MILGLSYTDADFLGSLLSANYSNLLATPSSVNAEKQFLEMRGEVLEALPGSTFRIKLENDMEVIGYLAGKLRKNRIRVMPGDDVKCEISPYDLTKARITFRF